MKKNYGLTNTERQIMELLWAAPEPMSFRGIMKSFACFVAAFIGDGNCQKRTRRIRETVVAADG